MTLHQLNSLTEDELALALYVVNTLSPVGAVGEIPPRGLTWFRKGMLEQKLHQCFPHLTKEAHPIFSSLLTKLDMPHEIRYEQPPLPMSASVTASVSGSL